MSAKAKEVRAKVFGVVSPTPQEVSRLFDEGSSDAGGGEGPGPTPTKANHQLGRQNRRVGPTDLGLLSQVKAEDYNRLFERDEVAHGAACQGRAGDFTTARRMADACRAEFDA